MSTELPQVFIVRHGETEWSLSGRHTGRTDIPLTARGEENARAVGARLVGRQFSAVLTSPLRRARHTCELAGFGSTAVVDPDLVEWDYGDYEGLKTVAIRSQRPNWDLFRAGCPGGETAEMIGARVDRVVGRLRAARGDVLLFAHAHVLRVLAARWLRLPPIEGRRFLLSPAALGILSFEHGSPEEPVLRLWNDTGSIPGA